MKTNTSQNINVGVDTGKQFLDIVIRPLEIYFTVTNDEKGVKEAITKIKKHDPQRIVIEATGRLELLFVMECAKANLPFVVANSVLVRRFAGAIGLNAKTDKLDAQLIAHYGEAIQPKLSTLKPESMRLMADLFARRNQILNMQTMEKNRLQIMPKGLQPTIKPILTVYKNQLAKIEKQLVKLIKSCPDYQEKNDIVQSMSGIGKVSEAALNGYLPELGYVTNKQAAALVGVSPHEQRKRTLSGQSPCQ